MIEDLQRVQALLDRIDQKLPQHQAPVTSSSNFNINGGGWLNTGALILMGGLSIAMFVLYLSDRSSAQQEQATFQELAARDKADFRQQSRMDVQRLEKANGDLNSKLETQQAYINEIYRSLKNK